MATSTNHIHPPLAADVPRRESRRTRASKVPGRWALLVSGGVLVAYGAVLIAGYANVIAGLACIAAGLLVGSVGCGSFSNAYAAFVGLHAMRITAVHELGRRLSAGTQSRRSGRVTARGRRLATIVTVATLWLGSAVPLPASTVPPARAASATADLTYGGTTSQAMPVFMELARGGRAIKRTIAAVDLKCASGDSLLLSDEYRGLRIAPSRSFRSSFSLPEEQMGNAVIQESGSIRGRFDGSRRTARGTWSLTLNYRDVTTGETDRCSSTTRFVLRR